MTRTHLRKILGDILARKGRTTLVSASIFIGVLGVITLFTVRDLITQQLEADLQEDQIAMMEVQVNYNGTEASFDLPGVAEFGTDGLTQVEGRAFYQIGFKKPDADKFITAEIRAYSTGLDSMQIEPIRVVDGNLPRVGEGEVALEKRMADANGFKVGDTIVFRGKTTPDAPEIRYKVVGIVFDPYSFRAPSSIGGFTAGPKLGIYAQIEDVQSILQIDGYSTIVARFETFADAEAQFETFPAAIAHLTDYEPFLPQLDNPADNQQFKNAENFNNVLTMLSFVAMLVSGFLVVNVINAIVVEQKRQIGSMKSVGADLSDVFKIYIGIALGYGLIGSLAAILPAILLGNIAARNLGTQLDVLLEGFKWSPSAVLIGVAMGVLIPVLSALLPVYNGVRVRIIDALTDLGIAQAKLGVVVNAINRLPLPLTVRQALNNINRKKGRLLLTGLTLTSAVGAFMGVTAVGISLNKVTNDVFDRLGYQILLVPNETRNNAETRAAIERVEGVKKAYSGTMVGAQLDEDYVNFFTGDNKIVIYGVEPSDRAFQHVYIEGEGWSKDDTREGTVISRRLADVLGLKVGDNLEYNLNGRVLTLPVIGIDRLAMDGMWVKWDVLSRQVGLVNPLNGEPLSNGYYIALDNPDPTAAEVDTAIEEMSQNLVAEGIGIQHIRNQVQEGEDVSKLITQNISILNFAAVLIALVGAIGLLTTLAMAVFERQKEIGVMRSIGASSRVVVTQFLVEGLLIGFIAWVLAIPLSYGVALGVNKSLRLDSIQFEYPLEILLWGFLGMMGIAAVASIGPSLTAARKTVSEIIRYQ